MECIWPESLLSSKKKAIEELVQGCDFANQTTTTTTWQPPAEDPVLKILKSFTNMWWSVWGFVGRKVKEKENKKMRKK